MRKILFVILVLVPLTILGILIYKNKNTNPQNSDAQIIDATPFINKNSVEIDNLTFAWTEITNIENLKLIPNYEEKLSSKEIINNNSCKVLVNSGFYATNDNIPGKNFPLGLFISDGVTLANWQNNSLFDGILSINYLFTPRITRNIPGDNLKNAIQSGPIIKENGSFVTLKIIQDTEDRRILAAVSGDNRLFFLTIYSKSSVFSGPLLADVPNLIKKFETKAGITFADIINLDGGTASAFYSKGIQLSEISPTGAFFCQS